jgi:hypothetical protein
LVFAGCTILPQNNHDGGGMRLTRDKGGAS